MAMRGSSRRRELVVGIVIVGILLLVAIGCVIAVVLDRDDETESASLELSDEWRSVAGVRDVVAVEESLRIPGEDFGEQDRWEHSVRIEVTLEDDLTGPEAAEAGTEVLGLLTPEIALKAPEAAADRSRASFIVSSTGIQVGSGGLVPLDAVGDALADAVALRDAGATSVSLSVSEERSDRPAKADVRATKDALVAVATVARTSRRPVDLLGGEAWYRSNELPDPVEVGLVAAASERPSVTSAQLSAPFDPLIVLVEAAEGDRVIADVSRWLAAYDAYPGASGKPLAFSVEGTRGGKAEGWVGGVTPPQTTMTPFGSGDPWPADPGAPSCRMEDLEVTFGGQDAAAGSRQAWLRARNTSGGACAIESVPAVEFLNADGAAQAGVSVEPYEPSMVPARVVVPAGESVMAALDWQAMSTANDPDVTTELRVVAIPGGPAVTLGVGVPGGPSDLDILDGAEVRISPWAQGTAH
ncbi:hypothetical protein GCM10007979_21780 [Nocardioides albus]|uniref:DUF4232 domain-containing protein n=2 Tax=Nocardioides albus TaxID=1841 RepID=A0A7W5A1V9_9ACTN|nr:hypothetical protein [Nocardioides albus]GGU22604.1 hypothetical protein GCM10007979_21780 [Nocardioides albus]